MGRDGEQHRPPTPPELQSDEDDLGPGDPERGRQPPAELRFPISSVRPTVTDRGLSVAAALVALVIGLAVVKPWVPASTAPPAAVAPAGEPRAAGPTAAATPRPTNDTAVALAGPICLGAGAWRVASLETWRDQDVRVWRAVEPIADATGPLDPAIPTVPVVGLEIRALGWCAPAYGPNRPVGPALLQGWIVINGAAHELDLRPGPPRSRDHPTRGALPADRAVRARHDVHAGRDATQTPALGDGPGGLPVRGSRGGGVGLVRCRHRALRSGWRATPDERPVADHLIAAGAQRSRGSWSIS